jgi:hypothetical protein
MFYRTYVFILMILSRILENKTLIFRIQLWPPWTHCAMVDQNQPQSFFGNHLTSWPGFDPRDGKFLILLFYLI